MDKFTQDRIINISTKAILDFMRTHNLPQWPPEDYWWFGLMHAWGFPWWRMDAGKPFSVSELNQALLELDVQETTIKTPGVHTVLELNNIAFVYREKRYKDGSAVLKIAPHVKGKKFSECGHSFLYARGSAHALAEYLIGLDRLIPSLRTACRQAYNDGLQERRIREIKYETAKFFLSDMYNGNLPSCIADFDIADSTPGAADLIRILVRKEGEPMWRHRLFFIPYDIRNYLPADYIQSFADGESLNDADLELFEDVETGEIVPIIRYRVQS